MGSDLAAAPKTHPNLSTRAILVLREWIEPDWKTV